MKQAEFVDGFTWKSVYLYSRRLDPTRCIGIADSTATSPIGTFEQVIDLASYGFHTRRGEFNGNFSRNGLRPQTEPI
jgi:hypothetical protein